MMIMRIKRYWEDFFQKRSSEETWWTRLLHSYEDREITVLRIQGIIKDWQVTQQATKTIQQYVLQKMFLLQHNNHMYIEEREHTYTFYERNGEITDHREIQTPPQLSKPVHMHEDIVSRSMDRQSSYERRKAVQYAERWWNDYNPSFKVFDVDCTNYISQCLLAGGGYMYGDLNRERGWWYREDTWSFSWSVAHSMRWYLSGSTQSIVGIEVEHAQDLLPGDVICYDFDGGGRFDHTTIVVAKDADGMPLVNAHTDNSRHRYWSYEDSTAWTPNIAYKFFKIQVQ